MTVILDFVNEKEEQLKQSLEKLIKYDSMIEEISNRLNDLEQTQDNLEQKKSLDNIHVDPEKIGYAIEDGNNMLVEANYLLAEAQSINMLLDKLLNIQPSKQRQHKQSPLHPVINNRSYRSRVNTSSGMKSSLQSSLSCGSGHSPNSSQSDKTDGNYLSSEVQDFLLDDQRLKDSAQRIKVAQSKALQRIDAISAYIERLKELEAIRSFDFDGWCSRFKDFVTTNREKMMALFSKVDYKRTGNLQKVDFIQTILRSKFQTTKIEVDMVADIFDGNDNGQINYKDFLTTFQADHEVRRHQANDIDKIKEELSDQCSRCRCSDRYNVQRVSEGRYRFGNAKRFRLVRILRSTVMVRVGGGWVSLAEFLSKNDPCRVQGRTNLELRDQLLLASKDLTEPYDSRRLISRCNTSNMQPTVEAYDPARDFMRSNYSLCTPISSNSNTAIAQFTTNSNSAQLYRTSSSKQRSHYRNSGLFQSKSVSNLQNRIRPTHSQELITIKDNDANKCCRTNCEDQSCTVNQCSRKVHQYSGTTRSQTVKCTFDEPSERLPNSAYIKRECRTHHDSASGNKLLPSNKDLLFNHD
ncbi:hypothetical protein GJ496_008348, partial [Pomphorhynchus laevis]